MKKIPIFLVIGILGGCAQQAAVGEADKQGEPDKRHLHHLRIRACILKGDFSEASREIDILMTTPPVDGKQYASALNEALVLTGELSDAGAIDAATGLGVRALQAMAKNLDTKNLRYEVLKRAFLRGQYDLVLASENAPTTGGAPAFSGHRMDMLRARASGGAFRRHYHNVVGGSPRSEENKALFKQLSANFTRLHEQALASASSELERARIASQWWRVKLLPHFFSDSKALRKTFPFSPITSTGEGAEKQAAVFHEALRKALQGRSSGKAFPEEVQQTIARALTDEFRNFAVLDIPDGEFQELLKSLPDFCDISMPITRVTSAKQAALTMRWYMWRALIQDLPDPLERERIDAQVERIAEFMEREFDQVSRLPNIKPARVDCADRFRRSYQRLKDNRFVPYYKRTWSPVQERLLWKRLKEDVASAVRSHAVRVGRLQKSGRNTPVEKFEQLHRDRLEGLRIKLHAAVSASGIPNSLPLPMHSIFRSGGHLNKDDVYVFRVISTQPFPAPSPYFSPVE